MPKVVDHESRRDEIAAALLRVVARDGLTAASVRTVAAEAGWSPGAVRHYFSTQSELFVFAMGAITARVEDRIQRRAPAVDGTDSLVPVLDAVLPIDAEQRAESQVWLAMVAAAQTDTNLQLLSVAAHEGLLRLSDSIVGNIAQRLRVELSAAERRDEAELFHATIDGLALHATLHPNRTGTARLRKLTRRALQQLERRLMAQPD